jgi:hypothetical protein
LNPCSRTSRRNLTGFGESRPSDLVKGWTFFGWKILSRPWPGISEEKIAMARTKQRFANWLFEQCAKSGLFKMTIAGQRIGKDSGHDQERFAVPCK